MNNKATFDINLPSIPGKIIKFKIQNIKSFAFNTQKQRFKDNKKILTKKFVDSFCNFVQTKQQKIKQLQDLQTQAQQKVQYSSNRTKFKKQFRYMVPEQKKSLLMIYQKYKNQEPKIVKNKQTETYTFNKEERSVNLSHKIPIYEEENEQKPQFTDNYYFTNLINEQQQNSNQAIKKRERPSAVFKNETRQRVQQKYDSLHKIPGPGSYSYSENRSKRSQKFVLKNQNKKDEKQILSYQKLKKILSEVVPQIPKQQRLNEIQKQSLKNNQIFILDDRDRFGIQKFPIVSQQSVPGPGSYDINDNIQERIKKVQVVEEQRKLLRQWFNN